MNKLWFLKNILFVYKKLWYDIYMIEEVIKKDIDFVDDSYKDLLKKVTSKVMWTPFGRHHKKSSILKRENLFFSFCVSFSLFLNFWL